MEIKGTLLAEVSAPNLSAESSSGLDWTIWNTVFAWLDNQSIIPASSQMNKPRHPQTTKEHAAMLGIKLAWAVVCAIAVDLTATWEKKGQRDNSACS